MSRGGPKPDVSDILAEAASALLQINQDELADIVMLLALLTDEQIAVVRGALFTTLAP